MQDFLINYIKITNGLAVKRLPRLKMKIPWTNIHGRPFDDIAVICNGIGIKGGSP